MNYTTSDYLEQLQQDREDLVDNLETKGITGLTGDETFTELVPEVLNIETTPDTTDLRNVINMTDVNITSQTPFNDYPQTLYEGYIKVLKNKSTLMDNMPKNIYTGTSINIQNTLELPIYELKISKESSQEGTPSPSNPVEIKTVKGYRNLFDKDNCNIVNKKRYNDSGVVVTDNKASYTTTYTEVKPNTTYILQNTNAIMYAAVRVYYNDINKSFISRGQAYYTNDFEFTTPSNCYYIQYQFLNIESFDVNIVQLLEGTEAMPLVPYGKNYLYVRITNGIDNSYRTISFNDNEIVGIDDNKDELVIDYNNSHLIKKTGKILSYNGETITTDYMSTTGGLDTGATVYYVLNTPQTIELDNNVDLSLYEGTNTITNSESADMEIKYIKDTYE